MKKGIVSIIIGALLTVVSALYGFLTGWEVYAMATGKLIITDETGKAIGPTGDIVVLCVAVLILIVGIVLIVRGIKQLKKNKK